ncbi:sulfatase-like hydrolase/transferase [Luteolibacter pohnpeiensis]|uniref:Sulfatase-like hydrolase/transferase n=1 Tax=Luteolibacter pohnpeiensis TaxID=454153 RepID=A0A934S656_9BACT|nr:sulfatase-like hydrolase/transferase [Luteolibacter pohnpeiensis]MBK1882583.1 sulfatase-like hydrolase/transferase [Luteolibacter pohnpeiensis]
MRSRFSSRLICMLVVMCSAGTLVAEENAKPNIIAILVDDIGVGDFGFSGGTDFPTPNIDALAKSGCIFTNGYALPSCSPTRAALMTGRYPARFGIEDNRPLDGPKGGMDVNEVTLPTKLHEAGYETRLIGKWHLGKGDHFEFAPRNRGFDEFYGYFGAAGRYVDPKLSRNGTEKIRKGYITDLLTDEVCHFLKQKHDKPFFIHLAHMAAHLPQVAKPEDLARVPNLTGKRKTAAAIITNLDDNIGRLMATLKETGLDQNTLVFFISDNGAEPPVLGTSNGPHRGMKFDVLEGGIRVPFVASWPGHIPAGSTYEPMVHVMDAYSTSLVAAGVKVPANVDGVDLMPYVAGSNKSPVHPQLCWIYNDHKEWRIPGRDTNLARPLRSIREGDWKLVMEGDNAPELYSVSSDPGESKNVANENAGVVERLKEDYSDWKAKMKPQVIGDDHPLYGRFKFMKPKK